MITERQEKLLDFLIKEYITTAEPVSSMLLTKSTKMSVSPATIRNDLQELARQGFIEQPHTSAGRVPTEKAYKYFIEKLYSDLPQRAGKNVFSAFIFKEIENTKKEIENEMKLTQELMDSLTHISSTLSVSYTANNKHHLFEMLSIIGPSKTAHPKNMEIIHKIIKELDQF